MKYRKLKEGELIQEGDEVIVPGLEVWNKTARLGSRVQRDSVFTYRRRVPESANREPRRNHHEIPNAGAGRNVTGWR